MKKSYVFNLNQLLSLMALMLLSPALRLFPNAAAETAAQAGVFTVAAALPFILIYLHFICIFMDRRREGEGLFELSMRSLGGSRGRAAVFTESAWLLLYSAFVLRSSADRIMTTIYPYASPAVFIIVMAAVCLIAALGSPVSIVRTAKLLLPAVFAVLLLILFFGIFSIDSENLLPITGRDFIPVMRGSLAAADIFSVIICLSCFFAAFNEKGQDSFRRCSVWLILMALTVTLLCAVVIGSFGSALTVRLSWPFFSFVRNLIFFRTLERTEAFVVALWTFPDFLLVSMLIHSAQHGIRLALGEPRPAYRGDKLFSMKRRRWIIPLCSLFSAIAALLIAPRPEDVEFWSKKLIPLINLIFAFIFIPSVYLIGIKRKEL